MKEFKNEEIYFSLISSNWRMQNSENRGPDCLTSLLQVQNSVPATLTLFAYDEDNESIHDIKNLIDSNTRENWSILSSKIKNNKKFKYVDLIAFAIVENQQLELHVISILNKGRLYVFELVSFADDKYAEKDLEHILETVEFL